MLVTVRTKHVGHIRDVRRLVVAVSRARLGLYVFARLDLFRTCPELQPVIEQFTSRPNELHLTPWERYSEALVTPASMHEVAAAAHGKLSTRATTNGSSATETAAQEKVQEGGTTSAVEDAAPAGRKVDHVALEQLPHAPLVCEGVHQLSHYVQELYNARVVELTRLHQAELERQQEMQKLVCLILEVNFDLGVNYSVNEC